MPGCVQVSVGISVEEADFPAQLFQVSAASCAAAMDSQTSPSLLPWALGYQCCPVTSCSMLFPGLQVLIYSGIHKTHKWYFTPSIH